MRTSYAWIIGGILVIGGLSMAFMQQRPTPADAPAEKRVPIAFDGERAMKYLKAVCDLGPRTSGSSGMEKQIELVKTHFEKHGAQVELQKFQAKQLSQPKPIGMTNLIARWHPDRTRRLLLCAHYDTRPLADQEPNPAKWNEPFLAANDGASGVAFMMELAHHMNKVESRFGIDFVLFDGEEYIFNPISRERGGDRYFFGSEFFAQNHARLLRTQPNHPRYYEAVLVDMIAGKDPKFYYEQHSIVQAGRLCEKLWRYAAVTKSSAFIPEVKHLVLDDHLALLQVGIPTVDIIDFDYKHWHRLSDVPENCSSDGMEQAAKVILMWFAQ
jgi:hypothetical protein